MARPNLAKIKKPSFLKNSLITIMIDNNSIRNNSDIILDFDSTDFDNDKEKLKNLLDEYIEICKLKDKESSRNSADKNDGKNGSMGDNNDIHMNDYSSYCFEITLQSQAVGWSFAKLIISYEFYLKLLKVFDPAFDSYTYHDIYRIVRNYKPNGIYYTSTADIDLFISLLNKILKEKGFNSFLKVGMEMANFDRGGYATGAGFATGGC
jgi:hypothetical protein